MLIVSLDASNEELRAQIRSLQYDAAQWEKEREVLVLHHQKEMTDAQAKSEAEIRRALESGGTEKTAAVRYEALLRDIKVEREQFVGEKTDLERKLRTTTGQRSSLQEQLDDTQEELGNLERDMQRKLVDVTQRADGLQKANNELQEDFQVRLQQLQQTKQKLSTQEDRVGELEEQITQLKSASDDPAILVYHKQEVAQQAEQLQKLETDLAAQTAELTELRQLRSSRVGAESELVLLQKKASSSEKNQAEAEDLRERVRELEDQQTAWTVYLQSHGAADSESRFQSPEDLARAYMTERITRATLEEQVGLLQAENTAKESRIQTLESSKSLTQGGTASTMNGPMTPAPVDSKLVARLERQKNLAVKEADFLRAQLKEYEAGDGEEPQQINQDAAARITNLESLLAEQKKEAETLTRSLGEVEKSLQRAQMSQASPVRAGTKRALDDEADERLGALLRKNRQLQTEVGKLHSQNSVLDNECKAQAAQLRSLKQKSRMRVLEMRENPTAHAEKIKQRALDALRAENEALQAQIAGRLPTTARQSDGETTDSGLLVPRGSLDVLELALDDKEATIASRDKSLRRLRDVFGAKGLEFREAVYSLLGWKLDFMPNGRVKASSMYYPGTEAGRPKDDDGDDEEEHFIMFDGENGTMKISGGAESEFAKEIRGLVDFWVGSRGSVPGLMAAMTLEFWDKYKTS